MGQRRWPLPSPIPSRYACRWLVRCVRRCGLASGDLGETFLAILGSEALRVKEARARQL